MKYNQGEVDEGGLKTVLECNAWLQWQSAVSAQWKSFGHAVLLLLDPRRAGSRVRSSPLHKTSTKPQDTTAEPVHRAAGRLTRVTPVRDTHANVPPWSLITLGCLNISLQTQPNATVNV